MPTTSTARRTLPDLPLPLDTDGPQARRVHAGLRTAILDGRLAAGTRLPSSRALAAQWGVARHAVVAAFELLQSEGLADGRHGAGTFVAARLPGPPEPAARPRAGVGPGARLHTAGEPAARSHKGAAPPAARDGRPFALGAPMPDPALQQALARALARHARRAAPALLDYGDPRGAEPLRVQIAAHLAATRGIACDPGCIVVVPGAPQALRLCAQALLAPGDAVWVEDPGYPTAWRTLQAAGLVLRPVAVDGQGLDVAAGLGRHPKARAAYVTPSHQFPLGVTMSMPRRIALLDWARASGAWLLEDDYDSEFRYDGPPLTALAGIDGGERVIYLGTFSKTLFPSLRLAYLVLPPAVRDRVLAARASFDRCGPTLLELAVADLMAEGEFAAHVRRVRRHCRAARDRLAELLPRRSGGWLQVLPPSQGLHLLATLPAGAPPDAGARIRDEAGVAVALLSELRCGPRPVGEALVLGFGGHALPALEAAASKLAGAAKKVLGRP